MSRTLGILQRARDDVDAIFRWLMKRSVRGAIAWYMAFHSAVADVGSSPERFAVASESATLGRELYEAFFKTRRGRVYRIVFAYSDSEVVILRVRGPGQRPLRRRDLPHGA